MTEISDSFMIPTTLASARPALDRAIHSLRLTLSQQDESHSVVRIPMGWTQNPGEVQVLLEETPGGTSIMLNGSMWGFGPIMEHNLRRQMAQLREAIEQAVLEQPCEVSPAGDRQEKRRASTGYGIAALVVGLFASIISFLQSFLIGGAGILASSERMTSEAGLGILMSISALIGAGLAVGKPAVGVWFLGIAAGIGIVGGIGAGMFKDLLVWGIILGIAATLCGYAIPRGR